MNHHARLLPLCACALLAAASCNKRDDGSDRTAAEELPALVLRDDTPDLLLTWIDERGGTHTALMIAEIPAVGREPVRVIARDAGHGQLFYVADLRAKQADGSYRVRTMARAQWEELIAARRKKQKPAPPVASGEPGSVDPSDPRPGDSSAAVHAIVYGADWCRPCHQVKAHLQKRGVQVTMYDVEREPSRGAEMRRKLQAAGRGGGSIPVTDIGGQILVGFNPTVLDRAVAKAQKEVGTAL